MPEPIERTFHQTSEDPEEHISDPHGTVAILLMVLLMLMLVALIYAIVQAA